MKAGEYGLTRGTRFVARCLEVVAVAGLMWVSWCACGGARFFLFRFFFFFSSNAHGLLQVRGHLALFTSLLVKRQGRESEAIESVFCLKAKKPLHNEARPRERSDRGVFCLLAEKSLHTGVRTGCHYLIGPSVCVCACVCNIRRFD